jgi:hypothetical protein
MNFGVRYTCALHIWRLEERFQGCAVHTEAGLPLPFLATQMENPICCVQLQAKERLDAAAAGCSAPLFLFSPKLI